MAPNPIKITGISLCDEPPYEGRKDTLLAKFEFELAGIRFSDCALVRFKSGNIRAFPPRKDGMIVIKILDADLHEAITAAARTFYEKLQGALSQ